MAQVAVAGETLEDRKIARGIWIADFLRWVSALAVVLSHVRNDIFVDYEQAPNLGVMLKLFYLFSGFGHQAVIVFFVLSGYLVGGDFWLRHSTSVSRRAFVDYFVHRFSRIYIVLVPALLLTWVLDRAGQAWFASSHFYDHAGWSSSLDFVVSGRSGAGTFFCNIANLQQALCSPFGSDAPLWSLSYEWFYYLTFPLLLLVALRVAGRRERSAAALYAVHAGVAGALLVLATLALPVFAVFIVAYPIWLFGVAARIAVTRHVMPRKVTVLAFLVALAALAAGRLNYGAAQANDYLLGLGVAVVLADIRVVRGRGWLRPASERLAGFSYSLYAIHFPILLFALAMLRAVGALPTRLPPGPIAWSYLASIMVAVYASAWIFAQATEAQTGQMRRVISGWLETSPIGGPSR